jgi:hypothetical protein
MCPVRLWVFRLFSPRVCIMITFIQHSLECASSEYNRCVHLVVLVVDFEEVSAHIIIDIIYLFKYL